jgi:hypothetical protein
MVQMDLSTSQRYGWMILVLLNKEYFREHLLELWKGEQGRIISV